MAQVNITQTFVDTVKVDKPTTYTDKRLKGFQVTVSKAGTKSYYFKFSQSGKQFKKNLGKHPGVTLKDAKSSYMDLYQELSQGVIQQHKRMTLRQFMDSHYKNHLLSKNKSAKDSIRTLETHFLSWLGECALEDITVIKLANWRDKRILDGISPNTVKRNLTEIKALFNYVVDELGYLKVNPIGRLKNPKEVEVEEKLYLSDFEYRKIIDTVERYKKAFGIYAGIDLQASREFKFSVHNSKYDYIKENYGLEIRPHVFPYYLPFAIEIALYTGMRKSEIFSLEWENIDFESNLITLKASQTKASRGRTIAISPQLATNIGLLEFFQGKAKPHGKVFAVKDPKKAMKTFQENTGLNTLIGWHHYRHNFASSLVLKNIPLPVVMSLMGHSKLETTQRYLSVRTEDLSEAVAVLDSVIALGLEAQNY
jgi:integrase